MSLTVSMRFFRNSPNTPTAPPDTKPDTKPAPAPDEKPDQRPVEQPPPSFVPDPGGPGEPGPDVPGVCPIHNSLN